MTCILTFQLSTEEMTTGDRITESLRLEGTSSDYLLQPPCSHRVTCSLSKSVSSNVFDNGHATAILANIFQSCSSFPVDMRLG